METESLLAVQEDADGSLIGKNHRFPLPRDPRIDQRFPNKLSSAFIE
jgi:hypothetical protein